MTDAEFHASSPEEVRRLRDGLHARGQKLVFTNGCFDLLHAGHVRYLNEARALGDALVVALNSDSSVRELKGPNRPVNTENDRAEVMAALRAVDAVVIFSNPRATELIKAIHPHVYVKGGDYTVESLNPEEKAALDAVGAEIRILPLVPGRSTTKTLQRAAQPEQGKEGRLRLGVLGSGKGSNFQAILDAIKSGKLDAEVAVAISDRADSRFLEIARASGLHAQAVDGGPGSRLSESAQKEICEHLQRANVDVVVLTGFMRILKEPVLSTYSGRIVNVHPSLLPLYKGANAPALAIADGAKQTGCTVHLVTAEIDGGAILAQSTVPVLPGDTPEVLHERIKGEEHKLLPRVLAEWRQQ